MEDMIFVLVYSMFVVYFVFKLVDINNEPDK